MIPRIARRGLLQIPDVELAEQSAARDKASSGSPAKRQASSWWSLTANAKHVRGTVSIDAARSITRLVGVSFTPLIDRVGDDRRKPVERLHNAPARRSPGKKYLFPPANPIASCGTTGVTSSR